MEDEGYGKTSTGGNSVGWSTLLGRYSTPERKLIKELIGEDQGKIPASSGWTGSVKRIQVFQGVKIFNFEIIWFRIITSNSRHYACCCSVNKQDGRRLNMKPCLYLISNYNAVSYTHLDVYKRQLLHFMA